MNQPAETFRPRVYGSYITERIRTHYERRDMDALAQMCTKMLFSDVVAVGKGEKRIDGNSEDGFEVVDEA